MQIMGVTSAILLALVVTQAQDRTAVKPSDATEKASIAKQQALLESVRAVIQAQEKTAATPTDERDRTLISNERALLEAVAKADKPAFQSLTLPEGVWTTTSGFIPVKLLVDGLGDFKVTKWDIVNPHVRWLDKDSAVLLYSWMGAGTFQNQPLAPTTLASTVWTKRDGKWVAVHHQETDLTKN